MRARVVQDADDARRPLVARVLQAEAPAFFGDFEIYQAEDRREAARDGVAEASGRAGEQDAAVVELHAPEECPNSATVAV